MRIEHATASILEYGWELLSWRLPPPPSPQKKHQRPPKENPKRPTNCQQKNKKRAPASAQPSCDKTGCCHNHAASTRGPKTKQKDSKKRSQRDPKKHKRPQRTTKKTSKRQEKGERGGADSGSTLMQPSSIDAWRRTPSPLRLQWPSKGSVLHISF